MRVEAYEKEGKTVIVLDGENNVLFNSNPAVAAFVIGKSILDNPKYEVHILNNYIDFLDRKVMDKLRKGIAEGKRIKDVIFDDDTPPTLHVKMEVTQGKDDTAECLREIIAKLGDQNVRELELSTGKYRSRIYIVALEK